MFTQIGKFLQKNKRDTIIFLLLFLTSLVFIFLFSERKQLGELSTDSSGYTLISETLTKLNWPKWTRTPTYPVFLALVRIFSHDLIYVNYLQMVLNAFNAPLIYIILRMVGLGKYKALPGGVITLANYHIVAYTHTILTEGIIVPILLSYTIASFCFFKNHSTWLRTIVFTIMGIVLFFTKPTFYILPLVLLLFLVLYLTYTNRKVYWKNILLSLLITIIVIFGWQLLTKFQMGYFSMGSITHINQLGKYMQYGYLDNYEITLNTSIELKAFIEQRGKFTHYSPYILRNKVREFGLPVDTLEIIKINKELIRGNRLDFILQTIDIYPKTLSETRYYRFGKPETKWKNKIVTSIENNFYNNLKELYFIGLLSIACYIFYLVGRKRINSTSFILIAALFLTVLYSTAIVAAFGYDDYQRLNIPVEPLLMIFVYLFFVWFIDILKNIFQQITKNHED